jgi:hypothetical protein
MTRRDDVAYSLEILGKVSATLIHAATLLRRAGNVAAADRVWRAAVEIMDVTGQLVDVGLS